MAKRNQPTSTGCRAAARTHRVWTADWRPIGRSTSTATTSTGRKRNVVRSLDRTGTGLRQLHEQFAAHRPRRGRRRPRPRILELGSGHGGLSASAAGDASQRRTSPSPTSSRSRWPRSRPATWATIRAPPCARWTPPPSTRPTASSTWPCSRCRFTICRRALAARVFAEGTRVADKLLIIDLPRPPAPLHLLRLASMLPLAPLVPFVHDGVISSLRAYSPSALRALAGTPTRPSRSSCAAVLRPSAQIAVATRLHSAGNLLHRPCGRRGQAHRLTAARTGRSTGARCSCAWTSSRRCSPSPASSSTGRSPAWRSSATSSTPTINRR